MSLLEAFSGWSVNAVLCPVTDKNCQLLPAASQPLAWVKVEMKKTHHLSGSFPG